MNTDCHGRPAQRADVAAPEKSMARLQQFKAQTAADERLRQEAVPLTFGGREFVGHMAWCEGSPKPLLVVVHNYAGLKQFDRDQAAYFARSGFASLAVDMYCTYPSA